jgi:hypothetical protein
LVNELHTHKKKDAHRIIASMEETTTGVIRLRAIANEGKLRFPPSMTRQPSICSIIATGRVNRRWTASSGRRTF